MNALRTFLALAAVLATAATVAADSVPRVRDRVAVDGDRVYLADIVDAGGDAELTARLGRNVLVRAPEVGSRLSLDADFLRRRLRRAGVEDAAILASLPAQVVIERRSVNVPAEQIRALVARQLATWGGWREGTAEIDVAWDEDVALPAGKLSYRTRPLGDTDLVGAVRVGVDLEVDGSVERTLWIPAQVHVYADVVILTTALRRGSVVSLADLATRRMDLGAVRGEVFRDPAEVVGKRTRAALEAGSVVYAQMLDMPPAVQRGALVTILIETPTLRISTLGEAQQRGALGDLIRVENIASGKTVFGRVVDGSTVQAKF